MMETSNVIPFLCPERPQIINPLDAGLVALRVMLDVPDVHSVVAIGLEDQRGLIDATTLSVNIHGRAGLEPVSVALWVSATKPSSIYFSRSSPGIDQGEPDGDDQLFTERCVRWCADNGMVLDDVILVGRQGTASMRRWAPDLFE